MTTIKSYTDLEQSKKLAEILPPESADMHYCLENMDVATGYEIGITPYTKVKSFIGKCNIVDVKPAWSLAALLEVLPKSFTYEYHVYELMYNTSVMCYMNVDTYNYDMIYSKSEVLVNACYEIILKLHKLNLL